MNCAHQTIFITGPTSGVSLQMASRLHQLGNQIIACGNSRQPLDSAREVVQKTLGGILLIPTS